MRDEPAAGIARSLLARPEPARATKRPRQAARAGRLWRQTHGANILSRLWFLHREIQAMRDSKTFLSAVALVAALVVSAASGGGPDRPHWRHRSRTPRGPAAQGRHDNRGEPGRVALVVHGDDRRQGPLLDHRPQDRARGRSRRRRRASSPRRARCRCAASARRCRRWTSRSPPAPPARRARWPASTPRSCRASCRRRSTWRTRASTTPRSPRIKRSSPRRPR